MAITFKSRLIRLIIWMLLLFAILFFFRLAYGYTKTFNNRSAQSNFFERVSNTKRNYASKEYKVKTSAASVVKVDQKYEKIAEIKTKSAKFAEEEKLARKHIVTYNSLIQFEQKSGNKGSRQLNLLIGVPPESFDSLYTKLIEIGKVQAKRITKKDKTNEYKELNAKKQSLEKARTALIELKQKSGKIAEFMGLENRILEIERQLQELGVSLGDFDNEIEFSTIQFSLMEGKKIKIGLLQRIKVALEWTIRFYLQLIVSLFFLALFSFLLLLIIEKMRVFERILNKREE